MKIYLLYNDQRIAKKKTHVKKRTLNPVFNESFVFELPHLEEGLKNISLEFMLLDWDRVTKNEVKHLTNIFTMGWVTGCVCPELSAPKPLDQSKNVTVRSYHKLSREKYGQKKLAKKCQKTPKRAKIRFFGSGAPLPQAGPKGPRRRRLASGPEGPWASLWYN